MTEQTAGPPQEDLSRPLVDEEALRRYLDERLGEGARSRSSGTRSGHSNETFFVTRGDDRWVLRRPPRGAFLPTAHDVKREYTVLDALKDTPVRTPRPILLCEDTDVIGVPFYVMERVDGAVIRAELPPAFADDVDARRGLGEELIDALAELHLRRLAGRRPRGVRQADGLPRAAAPAVVGPARADRAVLAPGGRAPRDHRLAEGEPARVRAGERGPRGLPAGQRDVCARGRRPGSSRSSTGRCRRSATPWPTWGGSSRPGSSRATRRTRSSPRWRPSPESPGSRAGRRWSSATRRGPAGRWTPCPGTWSSRSGSCRSCSRVPTPATWPA